MARGRVYSKNKRRGYSGGESRYNEKTLRKDREYGFYWYSWLWGVLRPIMVFFGALLVVGGIIATGFSYVNTNFFMPVNMSDSTVKEFVIDKNSSVSTISKKLKEEGFIRNETIFKTLVSLNGSGSKFQYGSYPLRPNMDLNEIILALTSGSTSNERTITIIPGWTLEEIAEYLKKQGAIADVNDFLSLCKDVSKYQNDAYAVEQAAVSPTLLQRKYQLEGYLAPDTYRVFSNASAEDILKKLLLQMNVVFDSVFYQGDNTEVVYDENGELVEQPQEEKYQTTLSQDETMILASIIEGEAGKKEDYAKVSAVFHNRILKDMALESDATIAYALGVKRVVLTNAELTTENPYNSYLNKGLPAGPICNPSKAAIEAALYPNLDYINGGYIYFCATDPTTGELEFSKTKAEHEAAVAKYRPLWEAYDQSQGN